MAPDADDGREPQKKLRLKCEYCGVTLAVPAKLKDREVSCPNCKHRLRRPSAPTEARPEKASAPPAAAGAPAKQEGGNVFRAWKDLEDSKRDSYWLAIPKACIYPYKTLGALIFFVVGVPVTVAVVEAASKAALSAAGASETLGQADKLRFFSAGVVCFALFVALALLSFFCSFLFAVIRTSSEGRTATPVIQGMLHRSNLAAVCAWAALYFGPGLYLGHWLAPEGETFVWTPVGIAVFVVLSAMAPMGLLCSATVSAVGGLNLIQVVRGIAAAGAEYAYLLLVVAASSAVFVAVGVHIGGLAGPELEPGGNWAYGVFLRILSSLFFMFPPVVLARALGLFLQYQAKKLPFVFVVHSEHTSHAIPQIVALVGCAALFQPLWIEAQQYAKKGAKVNIAHEHLEFLYRHYLLDSDNRRRRVLSYGDLEKLVDEKDLVCPAKPDVMPMYAVIENSGFQKETRDFIWIYEREPTGPEGDRRNILLHGGTVKTVDEQAFKDLLALMDRYEEASDQEKKEAIYREYQRKIALPIF